MSGRPRAIACCLLLVALLGGAAAPVASAEEPRRTWRYLLDRAVQQAEKRAYVGETLWVNYADGQSHVFSFLVSSSGNGDLSVTDSSRYAVRLGVDGGGLADHERGWFVPLPAADLAKAHKGLSRLEEKYRVQVVGSDHLLERRCTKLEITRRDDGRLVERLWVDDDSGLLLRRETYDGERQLLRMVAYLRLDLDPQAAPRSGATTPRATRGQRPAMQRRSQAVAEIDDVAVRMLRDAGWTVPDSLPGGYLPQGSFALRSGDSQPLQVIYSDGLYSVSLFEQQGAVDLTSLPPGATEVADLGFPAYEWPGALPQRLVWEASGTTYSLVGDAPPQEFQAMFASLPRPEPDGWWQRLQRGWGRLWSWVSPWS